MQRNKDWPERDNKEEAGKKDKIWVSETEYWELDYFIKDYLETRNGDINPLTKALIKMEIEKYKGPQPISRDKLTEFLDKNLCKTK